MPLTKAQIKYIEDYLIKSGINRWDIRLEMIDHLASKLENNQDFILDKSLVERECGAAYKLKKFEHQQSVFINKKYKKLLVKEIKLFFKSPHFILLFIFMYIVEFFLLKKLSYAIFLKINTLLILFPITIPCFILIKNGINYGLSKWKSRNLDYALNYSLFSFFLLNGVFQFLRPDGIFNANPKILPIVFIILTPFHLLVSFYGTKIYISTLKKYTHLFN